MEIGSMRQCSTHEELPTHGFPILSDALVSYRFTFFDPKPYRKATPPGLIRALEEKKALIRSGGVGIYLGIYPEWQGRKWIFPVLDLDGEKKSIADAISKGKTLLERLEPLGFQIKWALSGNGLRCVLPFLIPHELKSGLIRFLEGFSGCGIDLGPFQGGDPPPIRLFSYRGNQWQHATGTEDLDRHGVLITAETLNTLDEEQYIALTQGKPDPDEYIRWTHEILPQAAHDLGDGDLPDSIGSFLLALQDKQVEAELEMNVFNGFQFPSSSADAKSLSIYAVLQYLEHQGIRYKERHISTRFWSLHSCPICNRETSGAYLLPNGMLRCFSTNCEAYKESGGLLPSQWVPQKFIKYIDKPSKPESEPRFSSLSEAEEGLSQHLEKEVNLAVALTPGVGKTDLAVRKARRLASESAVIYTFPNHRLAKEWVEKASSMPGGEIPIIHLVGRREHDPCTCYNYHSVKWATSRGFFPGSVICPTCQYSPMSRKDLEICPYYEQFERIEKERKGLIFCTIAQLNSLLNREQFRHVSRIFIDEQPLPAFLRHEDSISLDTMQSIKPWLSPDAVRAVETVESTAKALHAVAATNGKKKAVGRLYTSDPGGGQWKNRKSLWDISGIRIEDARSTLQPEIGELLDMPQRQLFGKGINRNALLWLDAAMNDSIAWIEVGKSTRRPISFHRLSHWTVPEPTKITLLDATATIEELRALFGRDFDFLDLNVRWEGRRIWLRQGMGKVKLARISDSKLEKLLRSALEHVPENARKGLLVTHKVKEDVALKLLRELRPDISWDSTHFYAARGLNAFEDSEVVICLGVPTKSPGVASDLAGALFPDDPIQQGRWMQQQNEAELYQCAHRARFVRNSGRTLIVMGQYWPEDLLGKPDFTDDRRRKGKSKDQALERALEFYDLAGFFTKETAALVGVGRKKDREKIEAIQKSFLEGMKEIIGEADSGVNQLLYSVFNTVGTPSKQELLLSSHGSFWPNILSAIKRLRPGIGELSVKPQDWGNTWSNGLGSVEAAKRLYRALAETLLPLGSEVPEFNESAWRQKVPDECLGRPPPISAMSHEE